MLGRLFNRIHEAEKRWSASYGRDISTPHGRRAAWWHYQLSDHGFLRTLWTNLYEIAPGVWRSNQPSAARVRRYAEMGLRTINNLRGREEYSYYLFEREAAERLGIEMIDIRILARTLVPRQSFLELLDLFDRVPRPFVMHCKSGADRAGLASALYLMHVEKLPVQVARKQLSLRFAHVRQTRTGILDHLLDTYEADTATQPMPIRAWFETRYDHRAITRAYDAGRRS
jgi:protein tyrosine/serine phosphatase